MAWRLPKRCLRLVRCWIAGRVEVRNDRDGGGMWQADFLQVRHRADLEGIQLKLVFVQQRLVSPKPELFQQRRHRKVWLIGSLLHVFLLAALAR